jgi:hypothetical protein
LLVDSSASKERAAQLEAKLDLITKHSQKLRDKIESEKRDTDQPLSSALLAADLPSTNVKVNISEEMSHIEELKHTADDVNATISSTADLIANFTEFNKQIKDNQLKVNMQKALTFVIRPVKR